MFPLDRAKHIAARALGLFVVASGALMLFACAGAPVQEMSNARQSLAAAQQAQAEKSSPVDMENARHYLDAAQTALDAGDYSTAREDALKAQQSALKALAISQGQDVSNRNPP